jgi:hypothetical protein
MASHHVKFVQLNFHLRIKGRGSRSTFTMDPEDQSGELMSKMEADDNFLWMEREGKTIGVPLARVDYLVEGRVEAKKKPAPPPPTPQKTLKSAKVTKPPKAMEPEPTPRQGGFSESGSKTITESLRDSVKKVRTRRLSRFDES